MQLELTKPLVFFDLETTGVNVGKDKIIEISLLKLNIDNQKEILTKRINPMIPIPKEVIAIHGITNEMLVNEPTFEQVAHQILNFIGNADLAGYNSNKFDIPLLVEEFLRVGIDFNIKNRSFIDVQNIFHKMEPRTLKAAYKFYCTKDLENAHSAEADTLATYEILLSQLEMYKDIEYEDKNGNKITPIKNSVKALHDFTFNSNWADLVGHIAFDKNNTEVFNFGKHKGKTLEEVFQAEPSYYDWMMKADFPLSTKKIITAIKLRGYNS